MRYGSIRGAEGVMGADGLGFKGEGSTSTSSGSGGAAERLAGSVLLLNHGSGAVREGGEGERSAGGGVLTDPFGLTREESARCVPSTNLDGVPGGSCKAWLSLHCTVHCDAFKAHSNGG